MYSISQNLTLEYNTKPFPRLCWLSEKSGSTNLIQMNPSLEKKNTQNFLFLLLIKVKIQLIIIKKKS